MVSKTKSSNLVVNIFGLTQRYGNTLALDNVNLQITSGCLAGFIGPDGVGKSTLLSLISGIRKIHSGTVEVLGGYMADSDHRNAVLPRIAYMPQGLGQNLYQTLSVYENIDFFGRLFGQSRKARESRIEELMISTGLKPFAGRQVLKLSGGMKQKLGLCCALIHDPELLILDEPTTGVDPLSRRQFWELIKRIRIRLEHMSVLVATAYMDEAEDFECLVIMDSGRILATGSPGEIKSRTGTETLEDAFIHSLPEEKRAGHKRLTIRVPKCQDDRIAIEAHDLSRRFGDFTAVDHVSFQISQGEIFGFLGSNGCGKTTTMKMLTGLLPPSEGTAWLFGNPVDPNDIDMRKRVGYMSQAFSLYDELTVRQNLELHARLFHLPAAEIPVRVSKMSQQFGLEEVADELTDRLPIGIRQRLSLAVSMIHKPEILILDEPTSGVDPVARDRFWELLIQLSREENVTIFISTHFMNEGERCDRISLMHAGQVLAQDTPTALIQKRNVENLEDAFISYLEELTGIGRDATEQWNPQRSSQSLRLGPGYSINSSPFNPRRIWAYARRESMEIRRDPIRLAFALLGPIILMIVFGYGISYDVENLTYAVLDYDQSPGSRAYLEYFAGSRYFKERQPLRHEADLEKRLRSGELRLAIVVPPEFGKDVRRGRKPEIAIWLDGAIPFRGETARSYVYGLHQSYLEDLSSSAQTQRGQELPLVIETRFRYNQDFKSVLAMVPGTIMLLLVMIPAMLTAVGVVREKELGSITNLYSTPVTGLEFLLGKQLPYVLIALINFCCLAALAIFLFNVPIKGSFLALLAGTALYVIATTGFGLMISTLMKTQIAAIFATAIITVIPAINFSGYINPVSSLSGIAKVMGYIFPSTYYQQISVGTFTKALDLRDLYVNYVMLMGLILVFFMIARVLLRTQEP